MSASPITSSAYFIGHFGYYLKDGDIIYAFDFLGNNVHLNITNSNSSTQALSLYYIQF